MSIEKLVKIKVNQENRILTSLKILNGVMNLTPKELLVVYEFFSINPQNPCLTKDRKIVFENMELKNVQTLNNMIKSITGKGVFIRTDRGYEYCSMIKNIEKVNKIVFDVQTV
jgi:hypothetical protein